MLSAARRSSALLIVAICCALGACGNDGSGTVDESTSVVPVSESTTVTTTAAPPSAEQSVAPSTAPASSAPSTTADALHLAEAAVNAQAAIDLGDDLGPCPLGPIDAIMAALPPDLDLAAGYMVGVEDDGQVFRGGEVDITYCYLVPDPHSSGTIDEIRLDVSPGTPTLADYLYEELGVDEDVLESTDELADGRVQSGCSGEAECVAVWQGDGLFVATILRGDGPIEATDASDTLQAVLPVVVTNLAAGAN